MKQAGKIERQKQNIKNTPTKYARIIEKSVRNLKNKKGDRQTNTSKIIYNSNIKK